MADDERTRRALLTAGEALLVEKGLPALTVRNVEERAKLLPGSFQQHFQSPADLLRGLSRSFSDQMVTVIEQTTRSGSWKGAPARDVIELAVRSILDLVLDRAPLVRAFLTESSIDPSLADDLRRAGTHLSRRLIAVMGETSGAPARPGRAVAFSLLVSAALAHHTILLGEDWSGTHFGKAELAEEASALVCAYLGLQPTIAIRGEAAEDAPTKAIQALTPEEMIPPTRRDA